MEFNGTDIWEVETNYATYHVAAGTIEEATLKVNAIIAEDDNDRGTEVIRKAKYLLTLDR